MLVVVFTLQNIAEIECLIGDRIEHVSGDKTSMVAIELHLYLTMQQFLCNDLKVGYTVLIVY